MNNVIPFSLPRQFPLRSVSAAVVLLLSLSACSSLNEMLGGDKIDYRGSANKTKPLDIPPDLTQMSADTRYQPAVRGPVSASSFEAAASAPATAAAAGSQTVAPQSIGDVRIERLGNVRWLSTPQSPEQLWPQLQAFWQERNLGLVVDQPEVGVMETQWAENRSKLPGDIIRRTLGTVLDALYSTGELDKFRVRVERSPNGSGSEIYLTHRGLEEVYSGQFKDTTVWTPRPRDLVLENEILIRLMMKLGVKPEQARATVEPTVKAGALTPLPARARVLADAAAPTLQVDDGFDRAWRRVGLALDRSGFTVEDRDRGMGLYFVRYVDPASAGKEEPGFLSKLFGGKAQNEKALARYRVSVKSEGDVSTVSVLDASGAPEKGEAGQRILKLLLEDLK